MILTIKKLKKMRIFRGLFLMHFDKKFEYFVFFFFLFKNVFFRPLMKNENDNGEMKLILLEFI